jgi:tRNA(Ile)-lysidine synthase
VVQSRTAGFFLPATASDRRVPGGLPLRVLKAVKATIARFEMLRGGERVLVATSGGPDSVALLHVLRALGPSLRLSLSVIHVNHGLHRSSDAHARFVQRVGKQWGLTVDVVRVNVARYARTRRVSTEEAARILRYAAFARVARRRRASHVAVAHTADDQVETVLLWLLRGASMGGLAGMPPVRPHGACTIVRPLLDLWRDDVLAYLDGVRTPFRVDPTNRSRRPLRNRIRHELLPMLATYNPGIKRVLRRLTEQVSGDVEVLDRLVEPAKRRVVRRTRGRCSLDVVALRRLPLGLQRRVIRDAIVAAAGSERGIAFAHVERVREMAMNGRPGARADLPGMWARRDGRAVVLTRARGLDARRGGV